MIHVLTGNEKQQAYIDWFGQTKPIAVSLEILSRLDLLEYVEGSTKPGWHLLPFTVKLKKRVNDNLFFCTATGLHNFVKEVNN